MKHTVSLFLTLVLLWWVLSGYSAPLMLSFGAGSVLFTVWLSRRMDVVDHESHPLHLRFPLLIFWVRLCKEIIISNVQVVTMILSPKLTIDPRFLTVKTLQPTNLGKVILGNSITLTPGTVTVDIKNGELLVHALTAQSAKSVVDGGLDQLIPIDIEPSR